MQSDHSRNKIMDFIDVYRRLPSLWHNKYEGYRSRDMKLKAYLVLLDKYREIDPVATVATVKKKINILRTNYRKEAAKVKTLGKSARPTMLFSALSFLSTMKMPADSIELSDSGANSDSAEMDMESSEIQRRDGDSENGDLREYEIVLASDMEEAEPESNSDIEGKIKVWNGSKQVQRVSSGKLHPVKRIASTVKRIKVEVNDTSLNEIDKSDASLPPLDASRKTQTLASVDDEAYSIAKVWALELRKMDERQQLFAKKGINDILMEGQLGTLSRNSIKIND